MPTNKGVRITKKKTGQGGKARPVKTQKTRPTRGQENQSYVFFYYIINIAILADCLPSHDGYIFAFSFRIAKTIPTPSMANKASPPRILSRCHLLSFFSTYSVTG